MSKALLARTVPGETESSSNGVDLVSGMALATGVGPSIHWKTPAASAVPITHHRLSPRHSSQARQRCNLTRDISVDNAPMVLPVPDGPAFVGDSFPNAH